VVITKLIEEEAERGARLTKHLLAFARRQPLEPREIDANALVTEAVKLLHPTLGEHIIIDTLLVDGAWTVLADPDQLTTALLNLALNARDIKRYHLPSTPYERALAHPKVTAAVKKRLRDQYRSLDPVALLADIRATQEELGNRVDRRAGQARGLHPAHTSILPATAATFTKTLGKTATVGEPRATHRRTRRPYKTRVRMPSKLDPHIAAIEAWLAEQPQLTALAIVGRLSEKYPEEFGKRQHSIVQRLLRALRRKAAERLVAQGPLDDATTAAPLPGVVDGSGYVGPDPPTAPLVEQAGKAIWRDRLIDIGSSSAMAPSG